MTPLPEDSVGARIKRLRLEAKLSLAELAELTGVSKSYLWNLENKPNHQRPSGETLYSIAQALGTTMSELLGRKLLNEPTTEVDETLREFARRERIPAADVKMLASIQWRGGSPRTLERWKFVYDALKISQGFDTDQDKRSRD